MWFLRKKVRGFSMRIAETTEKQQRSERHYRIWADGSPTLVDASLPVGRAGNSHNEKKPWKGLLI
jgi:hypothetical protein